MFLTRLSSLLILRVEPVFRSLTSLPFHIDDDDTAAGSRFDTYDLQSYLILFLTTHKRVLTKS
jgi:hypothetical protein